MNDGFSHEELFSATEVTRDDSYEPRQRYGGECLTVYYNRLRRDGWGLIDSFENAKWNSETVFEKKLPMNWLFRKVCHEQIGSPKGKGCYWDEHALINENGETISNPGWEWADWVDESIVYSENGCLYKVAIESSNRLGKATLLHDFNDYTFENRQAPY